MGHKEHVEVYGQDNDQRLTGHHETASIHKFSYGVADRGASIRIPNQAEKEGCGYFEDRRPASNCDPYVVTSMIAHTTILWDGDSDLSLAEGRCLGINLRTSLD